MENINLDFKVLYLSLGQTLGNTISYQHKNKFKIPSEKYVQLTNHGLKNIKKINYPIQKKILQLLYKSPNYKANLSLFKKRIAILSPSLQNSGI